VCRRCREAAKRQDRDPEDRSAHPAPTKDAVETMAEVPLETTCCPNHRRFEATERCDQCGKLWCALCNPPARRDARRDPAVSSVSRENPPFDSDS
jgi:hypothetical protein